MILDLVDKLLDRLIQLARYQQEVRQNLYENYVVPAYSQFELVHNNYLETFKNYRELIKSAEETTDIRSSILDKIKEDSIFTGNQRAKLSGLTCVHNDPNVGKFIGAILRYTTDATEELHPSDVMLNMPRLTLIEGLVGILGSPPKMNKTKKDMALELLDSKVEVLQYNYSIVTREYFQLKKDLLMK